MKCIEYHCSANASLLTLSCIFDHVIILQGQLRSARLTVLCFLITIMYAYFKRNIMYAKFLKLSIQVFFSSFISFYPESMETYAKTEAKNIHTHHSNSTIQFIGVITYGGTGMAHHISHLEYQGRGQDSYVNGTAGVNTVKETRMGKSIAVHKSDSTGRYGTHGM